MNLFVLDKNPHIAARLQLNKHIIKMPEETGNLLLWPFKLLGMEMPPTVKGSPKKLSHKNHPASLWVRESRENFLWTFKHLTALCAEYSARYGRKHFAETYLAYIRKHYSKLVHFGFISEGITPFARCFSAFKAQLDATEPDTVQAYRKFYILDKEDIALWPSKSHIPDWWVSKSSKYIDPSFIDGVYQKRKSKKKLTRKPQFATI